MKKQIFTVALCAGLLSTLSFARGGYHSNKITGNQNASVYTTNLGLVTSTLPVADLTDMQKDDLIFMYQEEKLARDVYRTLSGVWGLSIFYSIQSAEQSHMDALKVLLDKYSLSMPIANDTVGVFENEELQALYDQLIEQGSISPDEALRVGVLVEETDIADLESKIIDVPSDISAVYQNLLNGSYNHLNAFNNSLDGLYYNRRGRR
jgi:hypothetical protein